MTKTAVVFPGQGSQYVGMGKELCERYRVAASTLAESDRILGFPLSELCFAGPDHVLAQTENTQPALLAISVAAYRVLLDEGFAPKAAAGHSLGEYAALVAAEAIDFPTALRTVRLRGKLMEEAVPSGKGTMAAILGLDDEVVEELCRKAEGVVSPAGYNAPGQVVVAGESDAVLKLIEAAKAQGAKRAQRLNVSGPFHSPLLEAAGERLLEHLEMIEIRTPRIPVYANVTSRPVASADDIRRSLALQVASPVRWTQSVQNMIADGCRSFVEVGPGRVLSGLIKRVDKTAEITAVESPASVEAWKEARSAQ